MACGERAELGERLAEQEAEYQLLESRVQGHLARLEREREGGRAFARELVVTDEDVEIELLRRRRTAEGGS